MSKICDRSYADNLMLSVKMIDGIGCCLPSVMASQ